MKQAVVFGAAGQMGAAVAEQLVADGWTVFAVTRGGRTPPVAGVQAVDGSDRTREAVLGELGPVDAVFDPTTYGEADALDLIAARGRFGALVVASSASVYEDAAGRSMIGEAFPDFPGLIDEETATVAPGAATYAGRKVAMERALLDAGVAVSVLRPCAVYGKYARHPREWWFIKRGLDERRQIPVAFEGESRFHTSSARGIAGLTALCMGLPGSRVLNVGDPTVLTVEEIAAAISEATGLALPLAPYAGPPDKPAYVGSTPWSAARPYVLDTSAARALGWDGGAEYADAVREVCDWVLETARAGDWREVFTGFAGYGYDPFDYAAEDEFLKARR